MNCFRMGRLAGSELWPRSIVALGSCFPPPSVVNAGAQYWHNSPIEVI
jgi:hypothetical protein